MITAAAHKKLKRKIKLQEDEITSCVFGDMQHLPIGAMRFIINQIAKKAGIKKCFLSDLDLSDKAVFDFWPKWITDDESNVKYVEPDLILHMYNKEERPVLRIIIEVKWEARLNPPCELLRQWNHRIPPKHESELRDVPWIHLYLVKDDAAGRQETRESLSLDSNFCKEKCSKCKDKARDCSKYIGSNKGSIYGWSDRLGCIGWRHIVVVAKETALLAPVWGNGVVSFFEKQGIVPFTGFDWVTEEPAKETLSDEAIFFRREPWFAFIKELEVLNDSTEEKANYKYSEEAIFFDRDPWFFFISNFEIRNDLTEAHFFVANDSGNYNQ